MAVKGSSAVVTARKIDFGAKVSRSLYKPGLGNIANAAQARKLAAVPDALGRRITDAALESWFENEALRRISMLSGGMDEGQIKQILEMPNRYPDGSMSLIGLSDLHQMGELVGSPDDILTRAREGIDLIRNNPLSNELGTIVRGAPIGGASTRAATWAAENPELAWRFSIKPQTPRFLYRAGGRTLLQLTTEFSRLIARKTGRIFPNILMPNSETVDDVVAMISAEWGDFSRAELANTIFFNQVVMPRRWVEGGEVITDPQTGEIEMFPAGHGDFPYLLAKYDLAKTMASYGLKYLVFSNGDEWLWQADPVMISIAEERFRRGNHMIIVGVENSNGQLGGSFVKKQDGSQSLVETPRLPAGIISSKEVPLALNTTFYICDIEYMADNQERMTDVLKSLVVKNVPGPDGQKRQILGVDSYAGDVFSEVLNPYFIQWPRLNFLGIKDGSFLTGSDPVPYLGGRSNLHYINETVNAWPAVMSGLLDLDPRAAAYLHQNGYSYLPINP